jgi:hypothetical protein
MTTAIRVCATAAKNNAPARKYCFKATAHLKHGGRMLASFTAYDKTPEVAATVQRACEAMRAQKDLSPDVQCSMVELVMFDTCPTECDGEISTVVH